jgi:hypothetical protein
MGPKTTLRIIIDLPSYLELCVDCSAGDYMENMLLVYESRAM